MPRFSVILPAAGSGTRFSGKTPPASFDEKKPFVGLAGKAVWLHSAERFARRSDVVQMILVTAPKDRDAVAAAFAPEIARLGIEVAAGGAERFLSVENGLAAVRSDADYIAIHDAARPCISDALIDILFRTAAKSGAVIPAVPIVGTIKRSAERTPGVLSIEKTEPRDHLWEAQTPQVFRIDLYRNAVQNRGTGKPTDDAGLLEQIGHEVLIVPGERTNIKITSPFDLKLAEIFLQLGDTAK